MRKLPGFICKICRRSDVQITAVCVYVYSANMVTLEALLETTVFEHLKKAFGK